MNEFTFGLDAFSWPTAWFEVPAVSPRRDYNDHQWSSAQAPLSKDYASELDIDNVPELDRTFCIMFGSYPNTPLMLSRRFPNT